MGKPAFTTSLLSLGNWAFDFSIELQLSDEWDNFQGVAVLGPRGGGYLYYRQSDGSMAPIAGRIPQRDYDLSFSGPWPSNLSTVVNASSTWILRDSEDRVWTLQTMVDPVSGKYRLARPVSMVTREGRQLTFAYGTNRELISITDSYGKVVTFDWALQASYGAPPLPFAIKQANLPGGYKVKYDYTNADWSGAAFGGVGARLTTVSYVDSAAVVQDKVTYVYGDSRFPTLVTSIQDQNNVVRWSAAYDAYGRATSSTGPSGVEATTVTYGDDGTEGPMTRTVTDALGRTTVYTYSRSFIGSDPKLVSVSGQATTHCPASAKSLTYGADNFVSSMTDEEGRITTFLRDPRGMAAQTVEASGTPLARTTTTTWHPTFHAPTHIVEAGLTTGYTYDSAGRVLTKTLTDTTTITVPYATNGRTRTWTYTWSPTGQLLTVDGPLAGTGDTTTYTYDTSGYLTTITNELGKVTTVNTVNWRGQPLTVTDPNGVGSSFTYDIQGRVLTATVNPGASQSQYQFAYDAVGNVTQVTLPKGGYLQYAYDAAGRVTQITNDRAQVVVVGSDLAKNVTSRVTKTAAAGTITAQQTYAYDELSRLLQSIGAAGASQTTNYAYDKVNNQVQLTDARTKVWGKTFDALNRVTAQTDPESHSVIYGYAPNDQLTTHSDGNTLQTARVVDGFGLTIQETSPDRGVRKYWYDAAGRMTKLIDGDNEETDLTYDNAGRLTGKTFPGASWETQVFTYDSIASGNKGVGRLTSVTDQPGSSTFVYDAQGRLTTDTRVVQGKTYAISYAYDTNGKVTQITLPSGRIVTYTRGNDGLVSGITTKLNAGATAATIASGVTYQPFGPLVSLTYGNGLALTNTYDLNYWLTRTQVLATGANRLDLSFTRNGTGALTDVTDNISSGRGAHFGYFDSGRLNWATGPWGEWDYAYDGAGNMVERDKVVGGVKTYNLHSRASGTNRIAQVASETGTVKRTLTYRNGGDLYQDQQVGGDLMTYSYSATKRPVLINRNGWQQGNYGFNAFGQRVWRQVFSVFGVTTAYVSYVYDPNGHLLAEHDAGTGAVQKEYIWLDDQLVAMVDSTAAPAKTLFVHAGQIGEPLVMTDSTKAKVWDGYVDPYGIAQTFTSATANVDLRFPGQWQQGEAGLGPLFQNGMREYDPTLGRYIQADPLGLDAGQNVYAYVDGRPTQYTDPLGLAGPPPPPNVPMPENIPGGPWTWSPNPQNSRGGDFIGPGKGPRMRCTFSAPQEPWQKPYWKTTDPAGNQQRYNMAGQPITPEEAHPPAPKEPSLPPFLRLSPWGVFLGTLLWPTPAH